MVVVMVMTVMVRVVVIVASNTVYIAHCTQDIFGQQYFPGPHLVIDSC